MLLTISRLNVIINITVYDKRVYPLYAKERNESIMKKHLSLFVTLAMLLTTFLPCFSVNAASYSDVTETTKYREAITALSKLNVINGYEDGTFGPEKNITRAEFTKLVVCMLGNGDNKTQITQFADVAADHWANCYIKVAYDLKIVNGFSETEFKPDNNVTYEQVLKMVVCMLGYGAEAEYNGGYPNGYRTKAADLKLTKNVSDIEFTDSATRGVVAQVLSNALEVDLREQDINGNYVSTDKTILKDYMESYKIKGTVEGVEESTTANCQNKLNPGQFEVHEANGTVHVIEYKESGKTYSEMLTYLGKTVNVFYRTEKMLSDKWLIEIDDESVKNKEITIMSKDIDSSTSSSIKYYKDGEAKVTTASFDSSDISVRYNGRPVTNMSVNDAVSKWLDTNSADFIYGTVKLIDNGSTGKYNVIDIWDYESMVALSAPTSPSYIINDKIEKGLNKVFDPDDANYKLTVIRDGKEAKITDIRANDVINYAQSIDDTNGILTVYATSTSVKGTISSIDKDGDTTIINTADNKSYRVTERFLKYLTSVQKELKTGATFTAYQNILGDLEWGTIDVSETYYPYAYVINAATDGPDLWLRLYAPKSTKVSNFSSSTSYEAKSYQVASSVKIDGEKTSSSNVVSVLKEKAQNANPDKDIAGIKDLNINDVNQLIRVGFDSENKINTIVTIQSPETATTNDSSDSLILFKGVTRDQEGAVKTSYVTTSAVRASNGGTTLYPVKSTTPVFIIPADRTDEKGYSLKSVSSIADKDRYVECFDLSTAKYPGCLLAYNTSLKSGTNIYNTTSFALIAENIKEEMLSGEEEVFNVMKLYNSNSTLSSVAVANTLTTDPNTKLNCINAIGDVSKGDIILYGTDGDKHADKIVKVQDYDDIKTVLGGSEFNWSDFDWQFPDNKSRAFMCNVLQVLPEDNKIYVSSKGFTDGDYDKFDFEEIKVSSSTKFVRYNADTEKFTPYVEGGEESKTAIDINTLKEAETSGVDCSKVLVTYHLSSTSNANTVPTAKMIVIYK